MSHEEHDGHIILPLALYYKVFGLLIFLTIATVAAISIDLGYQMNLALALGIALIKATFVCLYFMGLKYDDKLNSLVFITGLLFLALFLGVTALDTETRGLYGEPDPMSISDQELFYGTPEEQKAENDALLEQIDQSELVAPVDERFED